MGRAVNPGDRIEYAAHGVSAQADGSFVAVEAEDWRPGKLLDVQTHPKPIDALGEEQQIVVTVQPDGGGLPFAINARLVRSEGMGDGPRLRLWPWLTRRSKKQS